MEIIKIKAYQYNELNEVSKFKVKRWLDETPYDYEHEDENGKITLKWKFLGDMEDKEIQEYCEHEEFLFSESGSRIDFLKTKVRISK